MAKTMTVVVEMHDGKPVSHTIHGNPEKAMDYAVALAVKNTSSNSWEIRDNIKRTDGHEDGDYGVYVVDAPVVE